MSAGVAFKCPKCQQTNCGRYRPYCAWCGHQQPPSDELKALGLVSFHETHGKRQTDDFAEMNRFLTAHAGKPMALWCYSVSHNYLELRLRHCGEPCKSFEPWLNTIIFCPGTARIQIPDLRWKSGLQIKLIPEQEGLHSPEYLLKDANADVEIACSSVSMYFDIESGL